MDDEAGLVKFERESWENGDWPPAIMSFLSRHTFLPLLRMRDRARAGSVWQRAPVLALFYPLYVTAMVLWCLLAGLLLIVSPLLIFVGRAVRPRVQ